MKQTVTMMNQQVGKSLKSQVLNSCSDNRLLKEVKSNFPAFKSFFLVFVVLLSASTLKAQSTTITSSSISNNLCSNNRQPDGTQIIFTAGGFGQFYQWYDGGTPIGGSTASTTFTVPGPGNYYFKTSFSNPVPGGSPFVSATIPVNSATALSITNNLPSLDELFPTNSPSSIFINTTYPPDYVFIDWYRNGTPISTSLLTSSLLLKLPGNYMAVAGGCTPERSNVDIVKYETSNVNWNSGTFSSGATYSTTASITSSPGTGYLVGGDIVVQNGGVVTVEAVLNFTGCYNIKVQSGGTLNITNNSVLSATDQWKGILVEAGGVLNIDNNSYICDAVAGVIKQGTGNVTIQESTFGRNGLHVAFDQFSGTNQELVFADTFGHVLDPDSSFICGYTAYNNLGVGRGTYSYVKGTTGNHPIKFLDNEIYLIDSTALNDTIGWLVVEDQERIEITSNNLQGYFDFGLRMTNCSNVLCDLNDFYNAEFVAPDYGYLPSAYPIRGHAMYFKENHTDTIIDNEIKGWIRGMEFYVNNGAYTSIITGNRFRYGVYGLLIANLQYPITTSTTNYTGSGNYATAINLKIECNLFKYNYFGIVGSGNLSQQGSPGLSAGNRFYDGSYPTSILSLASSLLWHKAVGNITYYNYNIDDDPLQYVGGGLTIDNSAVSNGPSNSLATFSASVNTCTAGLTLIGPGLNNQRIEDIQKKILVYPNPSSGLINIKGLTSDGKISIMAADGKIVFNCESSLDLFTVDISNFPNGIYIIRVEDVNGIYNRKIVKNSNN